MHPQPNYIFRFVIQCAYRMTKVQNSQLAYARQFRTHLIIPLEIPNSHWRPLRLIFFRSAEVSIPTDKITCEQGSKISSELVTGDTFEMHSAGHLKWIWTQSRCSIWIQAIRPEPGLCSVMVLLTVHAKYTVCPLLLPETIA